MLGLSVRTSVTGSAAAEPPSSSVRRWGVRPVGGVLFHVEQGGATMLAPWRLLSTFVATVEKVKHRRVRKIRYPLEQELAVIFGRCLRPEFRPIRATPLYGGDRMHCSRGGALGFMVPRLRGNDMFMIRKAEARGHDDTCHARFAEVSSRAEARDWLGLGTARAKYAKQNPMQMAHKQTHFGPGK